MTTAIQKQDVTTLRAIGPDDGGWTRERIELVKRTVCPQGIGDDEFALFIEVCKRSGLDPLTKEIFCVKRRTNVGSKDAPRWIEKFEPQPAETGMLRRAEEFPDYRGVTASAVFSEDSITIDPANGTVQHSFSPNKKRGHLVGAWARLLREGKQPVVVWLELSGYQQRTAMWDRLGPNMIEKCARVGALRKGYPGPFGGLYTKEEMPAEEEHDAPPMPRASVSVAPPSPVQPKALNAPAQTAKVEESKPQPEEAELVAPEAPPAAAPKEPTKQEQALDAIAAAKSLKDLAECVNLIAGLGVGSDKSVRDAYGAKQKELRGAK